MPDSSSGWPPRGPAGRRAPCSKRCWWTPATQHFSGASLAAALEHRGHASSLPGSSGGAQA
eukprot:3486692-Alexandrium_andersonii.AAC.1